MPTWREFQAGRRAQTREFYRRHKRLRLLHVALLALIVAPVIAIVLFLDYGDSLGLPIGAPRVLASWGVVLAAGILAIAVTAIIAQARWREESRITETFVTIGFFAVPVMWWVAATCVLDVVADGRTPAGCLVGASALIFAGMGWMLAWDFAGPIVDFLRARDSSRS